MSKRAYAATRVNHVEVSKLLDGRDVVGITVGIDVGKYELLAVGRWADGRFMRPWGVQNANEIGALVALLEQLRAGRKLVVALEPSGTYGDALRQALADRNFAVERVGTKAAHDYAEVFDGVPSQHDGKDAAVVAELAALGKSSPWVYEPTDVWQQELAYQVAWLVGQRQVLALWQGRLEGLLARHWPEATRVLKLSSGTLLRVLAHYGSAQALAADPQAAAQLARWGGRFLDAAKVAALLAGARSSVGVRPGEWETRQVQDYAAQAVQTPPQGARAPPRPSALGRGHAALEAHREGLVLA